MKLLLTGMTAQQANPASHERAANYAGFLNLALTAAGHEVTWGDPSVDEDLGEYDYVVVGVAPITSLGANRAYGALSIIERLWDSSKLTLLLDAPDASKVDSSLQAITDTPENLTKPFFEYRKEYGLASRPETLERLLKVVSWMHTQDWPKTLVPALPWQTAESMQPHLPDRARNSVRLGEMESFVLEHWHHEDGPAPLQNDSWALEAGYTKWFRNQPISWDWAPIPWSSRSPIDDIAVKMLRDRAGALIAPRRLGTWWNTRYSMCVAHHVPVFTDWAEASTIGGAWATLPSVYEGLGTDMRRFVAARQHEEYLAAIMTRDQAIENVNKIVIDEGTN